MRLFKLSVMLAIAAIVAVLPASAWVGPTIVAPPVCGPAPFSTVGSGIFETESWTGGVGASAGGDAFFNGVAGPFGGPFFGGPCGAPFGGPVGGLFQNGLGNNFGTQNSAMGTFTRTSAFGLGPENGLAFGIPVPGPAGMVFC